MMTTTQRHEFFVIASMFLLASLTPFTLDGYTPSLPSIALVFHANEGLVQLTMSLFLLGSALTQLIYGPLSDRFGRKKIILIGISLCLFGSILCTLSKTILWLITARFIQGAGTGAANSLFRAVMRDVFGGNRMAQVASYLGMAFTVVLAAAPVLGGYFQVHFGWRASFIFMAALSAFDLIIIARFLPETNGNLSADSTRLSVIGKTYYSLLSHRNFVAYTLCSTIAFASLMTYYAIGPFLLQNDLKFTPIQFGYMSILIAGTTTIGQFINAKLVLEYGTEKMLRVGVYLMLLSGISMVAIFFLGIFSKIAIILPVLLISTAAGFVFSNAMAGAFYPFPHIAGMAGAMYGSLQILGSGASTLIASSFLPSQASLAFTELALALCALGMVKQINPHQPLAHARGAD
ncbi:MAG: bcr 1 [Gammaproteobacteria bacterium]|jgi:DHA1 family bicyclomycin/chloramphenicol resistance-like MFS transporter/DHA1 family 2-module integral membrane pump EmrD-like MFS transporter|nr:bcr 1 [Gammaproteobacteria bacterium]